MLSVPAATLFLILYVLVFPDCQPDGKLRRDEASEQLTEYKERAEPAVLRTGYGEPVPSITATLTVGRRGPLLLQDNIFIDEISHFDRERIPERVVHAKGAGAMGYFEVTHDITQYTKAIVFSHIGKKTNIAVRFSFVAGESGAADTTRDPRGFAIKFYTEDGIWDLVGNNTPVFFIRDALLFSSLIHSQKRNPVTHLKDPDMFWDFLTLRPESVHQVMILFSDRGIPDGYRHMHGFGSNTFKLVNAQGEAFWCKFHYRTNQKIKNLPPDVAEKLAGADPDYATRDLYNAIHRGEYPSWTFYIQVMTMEEAKTYRWNPFDVTKIWPHQDFPLIPVGRFVLNKNPADYFADVEQIAFAPSRMIPGIEPSPDKVLQGRLFSYSDSQRHRLGPNFLQLPVNSPPVRVSNEQRDGFATYFNQNGAPNYYPNSFHGPEVCPEVKREPFEVYDIIDRFESGDENNFEQPAMFWNDVLDSGARSRMITNIANSLRLAKDFIQERAIRMFSNVDEGFGQRLKEALYSTARTKGYFQSH